MPQFHVTSSPVQISQMTTQAALIQNLSATETVYLDVQSSVSVGAYGTALAPRSAMTWQSDTPLWAVSANDADVSVMYGADSAALGEVSVVGTVNVDGNIAINGPVSVDQITSTVNIDGTVAVDLPVNVQGGGETLLHVGRSIPPTGSTYTALRVNGPANDLTYYGMRFSISVTRNDPETTIGYEVFAGIDPTVGSSGFQVVEGVVANWQSTRTLGRVGMPNRHTFTLPTITAYPYEVRLYNYGTQNASVTVMVNGISTADSFARTDLTYNIFPYNASFGFSGSADGDLILLPPSYQDYWIKMRVASAGTNTFNGFDLAYMGFDGTLTAADFEWQTTNGTRDLAGNENVVNRVPSVAGAVPVIRLPAMASNCRLTWAGVSPI